MRVAAIVPAAGKGKRIKSRIDKPYIELCGKPILAHTLIRLSRNDFIDEIIVAVRKDRANRLKREIIDRFKIKKARIVIGGRERRDSVYNALKKVSAGIDYVLIHDGIRPFITDRLIASSLKAASCFGASVAAVPVKSTLKCARRDGCIQGTPDRNRYWEAQTPQVFKKGLIMKAYKVHKCTSAQVHKKVNITDDAMLVEKIGVKPKIVMGSYNNIKITTQEDLELAKILIKNYRF